jgi:hypothetical protein
MNSWEMKLDFLEDKMVTVGMKEHIKSAISDFPEDIIRNAATPAAKYLFETSDDDEKLSPSWQTSFIGLWRSWYMLPSEHGLTSF